MLVIEQMWSELRGDQKKEFISAHIQQIHVAYVEWIQANYSITFVLTTIQVKHRNH